MSDQKTPFGCLLSLLICAAWVAIAVGVAHTLHDFFTK